MLFPENFFIVSVFLNSIFSKCSVQFVDKSEFWVESGIIEQISFTNLIFVEKQNKNVTFVQKYVKMHKKSSLKTSFYEAVICTFFAFTFCHFDSLLAFTHLTLVSYFLRSLTS